MSSYDFDLFVIGGGSGGVRAARIAAGYGAKVGICEEYRYGGTCVIRGCVPKKLLVYASHFSEDFHDSSFYGWDVSVNGFSWSRLIANKDKEIDRLNGIYIRLLENAGVQVLNGRGVFADAHTIAVDGQRYSAEKILIATGGHPTCPDIPGIEQAITSNEAFHLDALPKRVLVVGGGYIAVEFAGIFNGLGSSVTQLYRGEQILRGFDDDVRHHLADELRKKGIELHLSCNILTIRKEDNDLVARLTSDEEIRTDCILYATGRKANTGGLGLHEIGIACDENGAVMVDAWSRSSVEHIFAVGDVTDRINLTPVAIMEGHCFVDSEFGGKPRKPDHENVASAVFSQPSVASVGLSEQDARAIYGDVDLYKSTFRVLKHTLTGSDEKTFMKLIVDSHSERVVGVHMVGPDAAELIQGLAVAIKCGATKAQFDATVGIHPTSGEEFVTMRQKWQST
jgi:glutathione reductase (NADPH)